MPGGRTLLCLEAGLYCAWRVDSIVPGGWTLCDRGPLSEELVMTNEIAPSRLARF